MMMSDGRQKYLETTTQTVSWFHGRLRDSELELRPLFQRNPVWTNTQKSHLIDSMLNGFPVPELYLELTEGPDAEDRWVVVDGQQRIRACLEYLEDAYSINDSGSEWEGLRFSELDLAEQRAFRQYKFVVRTLPTLGDALTREIFGRLNRNNMALNKQELRNATYWGRFISTMTELASDQFWVKSGLFTSNDFRRMLDVEYVSELAVAVLYGPQNKKASLDRYYEDFEEEFPSEHEIRTTFRATIDTLTNLVEWERFWTRWSKKSDFYTLFQYVASKRDALPLASDTVRDLADRLDQFATAVDRFLADDSSEEEAVREYGRAVERAASDLQSRRVRLAALTAFLERSAYQRPTTGRSAASGSLLDAVPITVDAIQEGANDEDGEGD